jgi:hypothetical protein
MKRFLLSLLIIGSAVSAQTRVVSPVTVAGDGANHAVHANEQARWVIFIAPATNATTSCSSAPGGVQTGCPHVGDTNVSTTRGAVLVPGSSLTFPVLPSGQPGYSLAQIFYTVATNDTLVILWAK